MTPAPESPDAAREPGWRFQIVSDGDVRAYAPNGKTWRVMAGTREPFLEFVHALFTHLATAPDTTRLTAERDAALRDALEVLEALGVGLDAAELVLAERKQALAGYSHKWAREQRDVDTIRAVIAKRRAALSAQERGNV